MFIGGFISINRNQAPMNYKEAREDFINCVLEYSECIHKGGEFQDCIKPNIFPKECLEQRKNLFHYRALFFDHKARLNPKVEVESEDK